MATITLTRPPVSLPMDLNMSDILEEIDVAYSIIEIEDSAIKAVARAVAQLGKSSAAQVDNRRPRPERDSQDHAGRFSYRPLTGPKELLRFWVLHELDELELEEERRELKALKEGRSERCHLLTPSAQLRCFNKQIVKTVLNHYSFHADVSVTQVLAAGYTAQQTLDMYHFVSPARAAKKKLSDVSKAKRLFERAEYLRFGDRIELCQQGTSTGIRSRAPEPAELEQIKTDLVNLLPKPALPVVGSSITEKLRALFGLSKSEIGRIDRFLDIEKFDLVARNAPSNSKPPAPAGPFHTHAQVPVIEGCRPDPNSNSNITQKPDFDMNYFNDILAKENGRRPRKAPGSVSVRVDGIDRGVLDSPMLPLTLMLEEGASVIKLVAEGEDGEPVTVAAHVLTYDFAKTESWEADLDELGHFIVDLDYSDDETVRASFRVVVSDEEPKITFSRPSMILGLGLSSWSFLRAVEESAASLSRAILQGIRMGTEGMGTGRNAKEPKADDHAILWAGTEEGLSTKSNPSILFAGPITCGKSYCLAALLERLDKQGEGGLAQRSDQAPPQRESWSSLASECFTNVDLCGFNPDEGLHETNHHRPRFVNSDLWLYEKILLEIYRRYNGEDRRPVVDLGDRLDRSDDRSEFAGADNRHPDHEVHHLIPLDGNHRSESLRLILDACRNSLSNDLSDVGGLSDVMRAVNGRDRTAASSCAFAEKLRQLLSARRPAVGAFWDTTLSDVMLRLRGRLREANAGYIAKDAEHATTGGCCGRGSRPMANSLLLGETGTGKDTPFLKRLERIDRQSMPTDKAQSRVWIAGKGGDVLKKLITTWAIDVLTGIQSAAFGRFADLVRDYELPLDPAPRVIRRDQVRSWMFAVLCVLLTVVDAFNVSMLIRDFGLAVLGFFAVTTAFTAWVVKGWWKFGLSARLFRRYHAAGQAIEILRAAENADLTVQDWRSLPLVRRLVWILGTAERGTECCGDLTPPSAATLALLIRDELGQTDAGKMAEAVIASRPIFSVGHLTKVVAESMDLPRPVVRDLVTSAPERRRDR